MFWIAGGRELLVTAVAIFKDPFPHWLEEQFKHSEWEGFTAWDLIMPLFLFVVGAAMPFAFARRFDEGQSKRQLYAKIIRRTLILFVLGMAVQGNLLDFNLSTLHIFANTLQAIAIGYFVAAIVMLNIGIAGQLAFAAAMLIGYWLVLHFVPLGGFPVGVLEPHANAALAVDQFVLGRFIDGTNPPYTWVLSGMTFTVSVFMGVFGSEILRSRLSPWSRVASLAGAGFGCLAAGWACGEFGGFPIIKHIWTSSMTLWAAGWCYLLLALFYMLIDVLNFRRCAFPFIVIGSNALLIYVLWDLKSLNPFPRMSQALVGGLAEHCGSAGPFLLQFAAVALWWLILFYLYRQKMFIRI
jgi:predicted acyltransferase